MKRYLLFAGAAYYPGGGWSDFRGSFDTVDAARTHLIEKLTGLEARDWWHIVDGETGTAVTSGYTISRWQGPTELRERTPEEHRREWEIA